jgi:hypothetical protein
MGSTAGTKEPPGSHKGGPKCWDLPMIYPEKWGFVHQTWGYLWIFAVFFGNAMILVSKIYGLRNGKIDLQ